MGLKNTCHDSIFFWNLWVQTLQQKLKFSLLLIFVAKNFNYFLTPIVHVPLYNILPSGFFLWVLGFNCYDSMEWCHKNNIEEEHVQRMAAIIPAKWRDHSGPKRSSIWITNRQSASGIKSLWPSAWHRKPWQDIFEII